MALKRPCLDCGRLVRGASRCPRCKGEAERRKNATRPGERTYAEQQRRRRTVAAHRATVGDWCPGVPELGRPAHPATNLSADHIVEVAVGGPEDGPLVVRCVPCNSARSAGVRRRVDAELGGFPISTGPATPSQPDARLHSSDGPVVA
jgi:5-methylcytosine-specific restriction enzyme A